ncbi:hypothetical protein GR160_09830 [Flavobacterium sp. Sd200]|uniref:hypothetical protein n=1 Tax=Flavobacterium sp. Sd200 TaxID=2692211 RepID=UPI001371349C|nr:hypothetical protein [Flavobacterium sp. Sd200]MXN91527.1 hypothetical protein [Flavobacterium sp. Sd200]
MKKILFTFLLMAFANAVFAQRNDTQAGLYNIGLGSVTGGIGAMINKKPGEKLGRVFVKGLWQGALGGYAVFESKRLTRLIYQKNELGFSWPSKIVNAAGVSIIENAAANRDFWEKWHINYGFNRLEISVKDSLSVQYKFMPIAFAYTVALGVQSKIELGKTLQTGQFMFSVKPEDWHSNTIVAFACPGLIVYMKGVSGFNNVISHEIIHLYQQNDFNVFNAYLNKPLASLSNTSKFMKELNRWIYVDSNQLMFMATYELQNTNRKFYYDNYFEHEAGYYSRTIDPDLLYNP